MAQMTMTRALKRWWKYLAVKADTTREERADPRHISPPVADPRASEGDCG